MERKTVGERIKSKFKKRRRVRIEVGRELPSGTEEKITVLEGDGVRGESEWVEAHGVGYAVTDTIGLIRLKGRGVIMG